MSTIGRLLTDPPIANFRFRTSAKMVEKIDRQADTFATAEVVGNGAKTVKMIPRQPRIIATTDTGPNNISSA